MSGKACVKETDGFIITQREAIHHNQKHMRTALLAIASLLATVPVGSQTRATDGGKDETCPVVRIEAERLPDLNVPRCGHSVFFVNGEPTVIGGHTNGFVLTPTAEYFKDGAWHLMPTVYSHDDGVSLPLRSGKVLVMGGHEKNLGIGQSFEVEMYNPATHTFKGFGCLDRKRSLMSALELDSGQVMITGNWYDNDAIELFDGKCYFNIAKEVHAQRTCPHIFRIASNDAFVVGTTDSWGKPIDNFMIDRLHGEPFLVPLFETWKPLNGFIVHNTEDGFIGDETNNYYASLMPVVNADGQVAIAKVEGTDFSLLPTVCPVPMNSQWDSIIYNTHIMVDRKAGRAYLPGIDADFFKGEQTHHRLYALCIDYGHPVGGKVPLTLYHTDPLLYADSHFCTSTPDGDLLFAGGTKLNNNFTPSSVVWRLHVNTEWPIPAHRASQWWWLLIPILALFMAFFLYYYKRYKDKQPSTSSPTEGLPAAPREDSDELMNRICQLMESEHPYLNSELKLADVAVRLNSNRNAISSCINSQRGCSFNQFINIYRVAYAQELMRRQPDAKISMVWTTSGFSTESTFFRAFKAVTGMTPTEWKSQSQHNSTCE